MISVMVVTEPELVRGALAQVLANEESIRVVCHLPLRADVVAAARSYRPAVLVADLDRYGPQLWPLVEQLAATAPECRVLLVARSQNAAMLRRVLSADGWGLASPDHTPAELAGLIRQVAAGERVIEPALAVAAMRPPENPLTGQEQKVLVLAGGGMRSRDIAEELFLAPGTVRNYLSGALRKTAARNPLEALRRAREAGWLESG